MYRMKPGSISLCAAWKLLAAVWLAGLAWPACADVVNSMEQALMPGELSQAHAKFESDCNNCHKFFGKTLQNSLCLDCHDHKNVADDIKAKKGMHGRIPGIGEKECRVCHSEHKGRENKLVLLDTQTFDHAQTDFTLRGRHRDAPCGACHKAEKPYHAAPHRCVDCHEKQDPHEGKLGKACEGCHGESRWQDFRFDHAKTDFKLHGKHKGVECRSCHPKQHYQGTPKKCHSCHERDDKHEGRYGSKCQDCHAETGWAKQKFDHDKDTKYPLKGRHVQVLCEQCHKPAQADKPREKLKTDCYSCHRLRDEHNGLYGQKCDSCHTLEGWSKMKFKHDDTDFPLKGAHEKVTCKDCHPGDIYKDKLKTNCYACHRHNDVHQGKQGEKCQECHNEKGWREKVRFDHNLAPFPLLGAHSALACEECHSSGNFKDTKMQCVACHRKDDTHERRLGSACETCHNVVDWKAWEFDHDKQTDFKLKGAHKDMVCHACHREPVADKIKLPSECNYCHLKDDAHDGAFGRQCQRCHNEKSFGDISM